MFAFPCTGARRRLPPTGRYRGHLPGHVSPPRCSRRRGQFGRSRQGGPSADPTIGFCEHERGTGGTRQAGNFYVSQIHVHLRRITQRALPASPEDSRQPHAGEAQRGQGGAERSDAPIPAQGKWLRQVVTVHFAYFVVPTNNRGAQSVPASCDQLVATHASAAERKGRTASRGVALRQ